MLNDELKQAIALIAGDMDIEPATLYAVTEVESGGRLFAKIDGRPEPLVRFEGHYFYRLLPLIKRNRAIATGLASPTAGKVKNPRHQIARWKLIARAIDIDRTAALSSVSWGIGQVMGSHWRWLGYGRIDDLVSEARSGVAGQVSLMGKYIIKAGLIQRLQSHDWAGFARAYNGPAFKKFRYDAKLAAAYERHAFGSSADGSAGRQAQFNRNRAHMLKFGSQGKLVIRLQEALRKLGYHLLADGDFGPATLRMLKQFQQDQGLDADGICGPKTFVALARTGSVIPC